MSVLVGLLGRTYLGAPSGSAEMVFVNIVRNVFNWIGNLTGLVSTSIFCAGILLSAILAASMSSADSQLLISSSAFASDIYKPVFRKNATDKEMMWAGRVVVLIMSAIAYFIAVNPACKGIMALVSCAWGAFGAAFGPVILLALYWKRLTCLGAAAGITVGFAVDIAWYIVQTAVANRTGVLRVFDLYEILPGFICGLLAAVIVSKLGKAPSAEVCELFDKAAKPTEEIR
jgi:sodium/proline symporter